MFTKKDIINLFDSILNGNLEKVKDLIENNSGLLNIYGTKPKKYQGKTPIITAIWAMKIKIVNYLIGKGADINLHMNDEIKWPPIHFAVRNAMSPLPYHSKGKKVLTLLIKNGANINEMDSFGNNALDRAIHDYDIQYDCWDIIEMLIQEGAGINRKSPSNGLSPKEIVKINRHLYSDSILKLFKLL